MGLDTKLKFFIQSTRPRDKHRRRVNITWSTEKLLNEALEPEFIILKNVFI